MDNLNTLYTAFKLSLSKVSSKKELEYLRLQYLGRKSEFNKAMKGIKDLELERRKEFGTRANKIKTEIEKALDKKLQDLQDEKYQNIETQIIDVSAKWPINSGYLHILTKERWKIEDIFTKMGFNIVYPFEIDTEDNNFTKVNIPANHPARDNMDTFWTIDNLVPITQTSSMQNRILSSKKPPIFTIIPGKVFRNEATDARHEHTFHQIEGIVVDRNIKFTDMVGVLKTFFIEYFENDIEVNLSPDYFPFVEPGNGLAIKWKGQSDAIMKITKGTGWLEVLGCGMIHPNVLKMAGIDHEVYTGFAWGVGIERLCMIKYQIEDIRLFHSGNLRFLEQF